MRNKSSTTRKAKSENKKTTIATNAIIGNDTDI